MIVVQVFVGACFGFVALFFFGLGCHGLVTAAQAAAEEGAADDSDRIATRACVGLAAFIFAGLFASWGVSTVRWIA